MNFDKNRPGRRQVNSTLNSNPCFQNSRRFGTPGSLATSRVRKTKRRHCARPPNPPNNSVTSCRPNFTWLTFFIDKKNLYDGNASSTHKMVDPAPFNVSGLVGNLTCDTVKVSKKTKGLLKNDGGGRYIPEVANPFLGLVPKFEIEILKMRLRAKKKDFLIRIKKWKQ